jgi:sigma-E factor negative regulatory protein RseB
VNRKLVNGLVAVAMVAGVVSLAAVIPAQAKEDCGDLDPEVRALLAGLVDSASGVEYRGVVTLQRGEDTQVMEVSHRLQGASSEAQLSALRGDGIEVRRAGHPSGCLHPGHLLLLEDGGGSRGICELASHYRFRLLSRETVAGETVAGREVYRLLAEPLDMYRFGYVFLIDRESALMLSSTTLAPDQRVLEQFQFASLQLEQADAASAEALSGDAVETTATGSLAAADGTGDPVHDARHPHPGEASDLRLGKPWGLNWLPAGFIATDAALPQSQRKTYTDGLASFSVFFEPLSRPLEPGEGVERQGSTVAYTRGLVLRGQPVLVTVLGEIPTNTARMVADSVRMR